MRIAVLGIKGIPAHFGGAEHHSEELYSRLAERGHDVTVFARGWYTPVRGPYLGTEVRTVCSGRYRGLDPFTHTAAGSLAAIRERFDIVHYHGLGPALFSGLPRLRGAATVATVHNLEWLNPKWGRPGRAVLRAGEWAAARLPDATIATSALVQQRFHDRYGRRAVLIPEGVEFVEAPADDGSLGALGLEPEQYIFFPGPLTPGRGGHDLAEAYYEAGIEIPLVIAGVVNYKDEYAASLRRRAGRSRRVIFTGALAGEALTRLIAGAGLFVLPLTDGCSYPNIIRKALWLKAPVLASDTAGCREALGKGAYGALFAAGDRNDLQRQLSECLSDREALKEKALAGRTDVKTVNDWETIARQTEKVYAEALGR